MDYLIGDNSIIYKQNGRILGEIEFPSSDEVTVNICHTHVDKSQQGKGIAGRLVEMAAQELRRTNRKAQVTCSFAIKWFKENPDMKMFCYNLSAEYRKNVKNISYNKQQTEYKTNGFYITANLLDICKYI